MRVFKPKYWNRDDEKCCTPRWHVEFTDDAGRVRRVAGFEDKAGTQELGIKLVRLAAHKGARTVPDRELLAWVDGLPLRLLKALRRMGLVTAAVDPRRLRLLVDTRTRKPKEPKDDLVADFGEVLRARRKTEKHIQTVTSLARRLFGACGFKVLADIDPDRVERQLASFREAEGLSIRTSNHILSSAKEVTRWAVERGLLAVDPLARLKRLNAAVDPRRVRRALGFADVRALVQAAHDGPVHRGVDGPTRSLVWRIAAECGLRIGEIQALQVRDLDLDGPTILMRASITKNRREVRQPIKPELASDLAPYCQGKLPTAALLPLPGDFKTKTPVWLKLDLGRAGLAYRDESGRVADCHSLRSSYVTELVRRGVNAKTVQDLARHATPGMTLGIYARLGSADGRNALDVLPSIAPEPARATGTDGNLAANLADGPAAECSIVQPRRTQRGPDTNENASSTRSAGEPSDSIPAASTISICAAAFSVARTRGERLS
jgi:integrase